MGRCSVGEVTLDQWASIGASLPECELRDRIRQAWRASNGGELRLFVSVSEAAESGIDELIEYSVDIVEMEW